MVTPSASIAEIERAPTASPTATVMSLSASWSYRTARSTPSSGADPAFDGVGEIGDTMARSWRRRGGGGGGGSALAMIGLGGSTQSGAEKGEEGDGEWAIGNGEEEGERGAASREP